MNTVLLKNVNYTFKQYVTLDANYLYNRKIKTKNNFYLHSINVVKVTTNSIIHITSFTETDYELPANPNAGDSVLFFIDPLIVHNLLNVNFDSFPKIKIYRNKKRIMGLEEHLVCDRPFQSLRLSYYRDEEGWIIV